MNQNSHGFFFLLLLFIFLLFSQSASAHFSAAKQGLEETHKKLSHEMIRDLSHILGGRENGEEEEEEWEKRRMMEEAHLDYVYTQTMKP